MPKFDKDVFECLIDKVIIGEFKKMEKQIHIQLGKGTLSYISNSPDTV